MSKEYVLHRLRRGFANVDVQGGAGGGVSQQDFDALKVRVQSAETNLNDNNGKITTAEVDIANLKTGKANDNEVVKLSGNQTIAGEKTFNNKATFRQDDMCLSLHPSTNKACYIAIHNNAGNRCLDLGKGSSQNDKIMINSSRDDLDITAPNNKSIGIATSCLLRLGTNIKVGYGGANVNISPDSGFKSISWSSLQFNFSGDRDNNSSFLNFNMDNISGQKDVVLFKVHRGGKKASLFWRLNSPEWVNATGKWEWPQGSTFQCRGDAKSFRAPTANEDIANKQYVDTIKTQIKDIVRQSTDFNDFKTRMGNW